MLKGVEPLYEIVRGVITQGIRIFQFFQVMCADGYSLLQISLIIEYYEQKYIK